MKSETGKKKIVSKEEGVAESSLTVIKQPSLRNARNIQKFEGLSVNKVPDIDPAIPPSSYLYYRYMHPRGHSSTMFSKAQEMLLQQKQQTIAQFELKMKQQQDRMKKLKQ